jgi:hypothetical protein
MTGGFFAQAIEASFLAGDNNLVFFMERSRSVLLQDKLNELGARALLPRKNIRVGKSADSDHRTSAEDAYISLILLYNPESSGYSFCKPRTSLNSRLNPSRYFTPPIISINMRRM